MFLVFNRDKIKSYTILLGTILVLFGFTFSLKNDKTVETRANVANNVVETKANILVNTVNIKTNEIINKQN